MLSSVGLPSHSGGAIYRYSESLDVRQATEARLHVQALELRELASALRQQRHMMLRAAAEQYGMWFRVINREVATLQVRCTFVVAKLHVLVCHIRMLLGIEHAGIRRAAQSL